MDAKLLTAAFVRYLAGRSSAEFILPNFFYLNNEMDVFSLTRSSLVVEYEVKISRSDYQADFKKQAWDVNPGLGKSSLANKHDLLKAGRLLPNKFYFVVPEGLIFLTEIPSYAGLIYAKEYARPGKDPIYTFDTIREPKVLHRNKPPEKIYRQIATKCYYRYFELYRQVEIKARPKPEPKKVDPLPVVDIKNDYSNNIF